MLGASRSVHVLPPGVMEVMSNAVRVRTKISQHYTGAGCLADLTRLGRKTGHISVAIVNEVEGDEEYGKYISRR